MADQPNPQQQIEKPARAMGPDAEPAFFVMPEDYRHGATGKKMAEPKKELQKPVVSIAPPPPPVAPAVATSGRKKRLSRQNKILLIAGGILISGLAIAWYLVLRSTEAPTITPEERPTPSARPAPAEEPEPTSKPEPTPTPTETESPFPTTTTSGADSDSDGLTDLEERIVYGTDVRLPDTDGDGFLDGNEVFHRYNPGGTAPGTLFESGLVKIFTGPASDASWYHVSYPSVWAPTFLTEDWGTPTTFVATTGEKISVSVLERQQGTSFADWLKGIDTGIYSASTTKNGYGSLVSEDQLTVYVDGSASVAGAGYAAKIEYDPGIKATIDYLQTFKMMVNSIEWL
ncbi:hypothetical protein A2348_00920 [Candidatus Uhrbacteria bacterium RIFOXYB12_FULL_58_10]|uniref:EF-hand domain-containing protein n=1 Tax=Candidatus Uhrbacteria bacterium RIFOXYB2_FULL_57_15 TaxID=1802422 RepID=A0A1F7W8B6_9BACT|nr:MAG: hypothetical protein A2348_00920 [Candidatus Uhrbacteria bacterium RIFOXYB12_FULL_58_10]OGL98334.1 MAG: hypothetical protein A2304_01390 [Candidatus Uhrbacteria bacterium RIFOXYB2_FULL_57_15]OGM00209.1 MAG: hypothetical protein A2501_01565 [Candidatus Uhrbacteria bacterium RIFOXYC12_FULL_57_11]